MEDQSLKHSMKEKMSEKLKVHQILPELVTSGLLTANDRSDIESQRPRDRSRYLIDKLFKLEQRKFKSFLGILRSNQPQLYDEIISIGEWKENRLIQEEDVYRQILIEQFEFMEQHLKNLPQVIDELEREGFLSHDVVEDILPHVQDKKLYYVLDFMVHQGLFGFDKFLEVLQRTGNERVYQRLRSKKTEMEQMHTGNARTDQQATTSVEVACRGASGSSEVAGARAVPLDPYDIDTKFLLGSRVKVNLENPGLGVIRWIGHTGDRNAPVAGVETDDETPNGTDGTYNGQRLFICPPRHGIFVKLKDLAQP